MSLSDTKQAHMYATVAEVAAAQCKAYTEEARKAPEYTEEAKQYAEQAETASTAAEEASQQAASSVNESSQNASSAQASADSAAQYANQADYIANADTYYATAEDPNGTIAGLAGTAEGKGFRVVIPDSQGVTVAWNIYQKVNGLAVYKTSQPNTQYVDEVRALAESTNERTNGLRTEEESVYPFEILDDSGKGLAFAESTGVFNFPAGIKSKDVNSSLISATSVTADRIIPLDNPDDAFSVAEVDLEGRVTFGTEVKTGKKIYFGVPLSTHKGALEGDFFAIGDSITAFGIAYSGINNTGTSYSPCLRDQSWHEWATMMTNGRLRLTGISATGGFTATQILNTHVPKAISAGSTFCVVMCGRNDVVQGLNIDAVTIPAMNKIFSRLRYAGIIPVVCTMSAQSNSSSDAQRISEFKINSWLRAYARKYGLPLVDLHQATVNPLTGDWIPGMNQDVSHPTGAGAKVMGKALVDGLKEWSAPIFAPRADEQLTPELTGNLIPNCLFLNNNNINPSGWTITVAGASSVGSSDVIKGNAWSMASQEAEIDITLTPGDRLQLGYFVKTGTSLFEMYLVSGTTYLAGIRDWKVSTDDFLYFNYEFIVPPSITSAKLKIKTTTSQSTVGQISLLKLTELK